MLPAKKSQLFYLNTTYERVMKIIVVNNQLVVIRDKLRGNKKFQIARKSDCQGQ